MRRRKATPRLLLLLTALGLAGLAALALSACGGGEDGGSATTAMSTSGGETTSAGSSHVIVESHDRISTSSGPVEGTVPVGEEDDEESPTGADPVKPCNLVSAGEASSILGTRVHVTTGPQGPTCIYTVSGSPEVMTLAVERTDLGGLRRHASDGQRISVGGSLGWCLRYGSTSVVVPLADGSVLAVTGPCAAAARFAARALPRISS